MDEVGELLENNRTWAADWTRHDPEFFERLGEGQNPKYLWIGCADSRVPAENLVGAAPGELFVHRNIANVVTTADTSSMAVLQFAVDALEVEHVIVCGHYGCGGVRAAMDGKPLGLADNWLRPVEELCERHLEELDRIGDERRRHDRLCELNVHHQVANVCGTPIVQDAWRRGRSLAVHGWIYGIHDGLIRDLELTVTGPEEIGGSIV